MTKRIVLLFWSLAACQVGCSDIEGSIPGLACEDGACVEGHRCHPQLNVCAPAVTIGCGNPNAVCPEQVQAGDACDVPDSFIPCAGADMECGDACRTCQANGTWSECPPACPIGTATDCAFCGDDCSVLPHTGQVECAVMGAQCQVVSCASGWVDGDGDSSNGCERACTSSGQERCDGIDNDCNGVVDDIAQAELDTSCASVLVAASNVGSWACVDGGCGVGQCLNGTHNINGSPADGCEYNCTVSGPESCDGADNDCSGATDDLNDQQTQRDCEQLQPVAADVDEWACTQGACEVTQCTAGFSDIDELPANGCESTCVPTSDPTEVCDEVDNDCDGTIDLGATGCSTYYADRDGDSFGDPGASRCICAPQGPYTAENATDCDDNPATGAAFNPDAADVVADGKDQNCDGFDVCYKDVDGDGYGTSATINDNDLDCGNASMARTALVSGDCDDTTSKCGVACNPAAPELCDTYDNNCDTFVDTSASDCTTYYRDDDGDTYGVTSDTICACAPTASHDTTVPGDCSDTVGVGAAIHPGADDTVADGADQDCDGFDTCYLDTDGDGYGTAATLADNDLNCANDSMAQTSALNTDCDDDPAACGVACNPLASEVCDTYDNNCDAAVDIDASDCSTYYRDADNDTYGNATDSVCACGPAGEYDSTNGGDCDDTAPDVSPGTTEVPGDGADQNCDGFDSCYVDADNDGYGSSVIVVGDGLNCDTVPAATASVSGDCDDDGAACGAQCLPGGTEVCDGWDNDCVNGPDDSLLGAACPIQTGVCAGSQVTACNGASGWGPCDTAAYAAAALANFGSTYQADSAADETACANALDDDCDGVVDDGCGVVAFEIVTYDSASAGLVSDNTTSMVVDASGNVWVGSGDSGELSYLAVGSSTFVTVDTGRAESISTVALDDSGNAWVGFDDPGCDGSPGTACECGPMMISADTTTTAAYCTDYMTNTTNEVVSMASDGMGNMYVGTGDDIAIYFEGSDTVACDINIGGGSNGRARVMLSDERGPPKHVWVGTPDVLKHCTPDHPVDGTCSDSCANVTDAFAGTADEISALALHNRGTSTGDDDWLWVGSSSKGLALVNTADASTLGGWVSPDLPSDIVSALAFDHQSSRLFVATDSGLGMCSFTAPSTCVWQTFTTADGLVSDTIRSLFIDEAARVLWIGTDSGVSQVKL